MNNEDTKQGAPSPQIRDRQIGVLVTPNRYDAVRKLAYEQHRSMSALVDEAIGRYLRERG